MKDICCCVFLFKIFRVSLPVILSFSLIVDPFVIALMGEIQDVGNIDKGIPTVSNYSAPLSVVDLTSLKPSGMILGKMFKGSGKQNLILIRDLHCQEEAQTKIAEAIQYARKEGNIKRVFLEGAEGDVGTLFYKAFPSASVRRKTGLEFMRKGYLSGAEFATVKLGISNGVSLYGVEDAALYLDNFRSFRHVKNEMDKISDENERIDLFLDAAQKDNLSSDLYALLTLDKKIQEGNLELKETLTQIGSILDKRGLSLNGYPNLKKLYSLLNEDEKISQEIVQHEQTEFIKDMENNLEPDQLKKLVAFTLEYRLGKRNLDSYLKKTISLYNHDIGTRSDFIKKYPQLAKWVDLIKKRERINLDESFNEISKFIIDLILKMASEEGVQDIVSVSRQWYMLQKLVKLELDRRDMSLIKENLDDFLDINEFDAKLLKLKAKYKLPSENIYLTGALSSLVKDAWQFYVYVEKRDNVLTRNTLDNLKKNETGILITGGFHTEGIQKLLEEKSISYATWSPMVASRTDTVLYEKMMLDKKYDFDKVEFSEKRFAWHQQTGMIRKMLSPPVRMINRISRLVNQSEDPVLSEMHTQMVETWRQSEGNAEDFWQMLNDWLSRAELEKTEWTWDGFIQLVHAISPHSVILETLQRLSPNNPDVADLMTRILGVVEENESDSGKRKALRTISEKYFQARDRKRKVKNRNFDLLADIPTIEALEGRDLKGKRVLVRVNMNVSSINGRIEDPARLEKTAQIVRFLINKGATPVLFGHNGRWNMEKGTDNRQSLADAARYMQSMFPDTEVKFHEGSIPKDTGQGLTIAQSDIEMGKINILENVRFADAHESGDKRDEFARSLIGLSDGIFIFDAFGDVGSEGASVEDVPLLAGEVFAGPAMVEEFEMLQTMMEEGFDGLIFGGEKLDKVPLLRGLVSAISEDGFAIIGSGPSPTLNGEQSELLQELRGERSDRVLTAVDYADGETTFDIGPETLAAFLHKLDSLQSGQTILVNGTMGFMEHASGAYKKGTEEVISKLKELAQRGVRVIVIGGDSSKNARKYGLADQDNATLFTGGGVPLKILAGETLSGLDALAKAIEAPFKLGGRPTIPIGDTVSSETTGRTSVVVTDAGLRGKAAGLDKTNADEKRQINQIKDESDGLAKRSFEEVAQEMNVIVVVRVSEGFGRDEVAESLKANDVILPPALLGEAAAVQRAIEEDAEVYIARDGTEYRIEDASIDVIDNTNAFVAGTDGGTSIAVLGPGVRSLGNCPDDYTDGIFTLVPKDKRQEFVDKPLDPEDTARDPKNIELQLKRIADANGIGIGDLEVVVMQRHREIKRLAALTELKKRFPGLVIKTITDGTAIESLEANFGRKEGKHKVVMTVGGAPEGFFNLAVAGGGFKEEGAIGSIRIVSQNVNQTRSGVNATDLKRRYDFTGVNEYIEILLAESVKLYKTPETEQIGQVLEGFLTSAEDTIGMNFENMLLLESITDLDQVEEGSELDIFFKELESLNLSRENFLRIYRATLVKCAEYNIRKLRPEDWLPVLKGEKLFTQEDVEGVVDGSMALITDAAMFGQKGVIRQEDGSYKVVILRFGRKEGQLAYAWFDEKTYKLGQEVIPEEAKQHIKQIRAKMQEHRSDIFERYDRFDTLSQEEKDSLRSDILSLNTGRLRLWGLTAYLSKRDFPYFEGSVLKLLQGVFPKFNFSKYDVALDWSTQTEAIKSIRHVLSQKAPSVIERYDRIETLSDDELRILQDDIYSIDTNYLSSWGMVSAYDINRAPYFEGSHAKVMQSVFPQTDINPLGYKYNWQTQEASIESIRFAVSRYMPDIIKDYNRLEELSPQQIEDLKEQIYKISSGHFALWGMAIVSSKKRTPFFEGSHINALITAFPELNLNPLGFSFDWTSHERAKESIRFALRKNVPEIMERYADIENLDVGQIAALKEDLYKIKKAQFMLWGIGGALVRKTSHFYFEGKHMHALAEIFDHPLLSFSAEEMKRYRRSITEQRFSWTGSRSEALSNVKYAIKENRPDIFERYDRLSDLSDEEIEELKRDIYQIRYAHFMLWGLVRSMMVESCPWFGGSHVQILRELFPELDLDPLEFGLDISTKENAVRSARHILRKEADSIMRRYDRISSLGEDEVHRLMRDIYGIKDKHFRAWGLGSLKNKKDTPYFEGSYIKALLAVFSELPLDPLVFAKDWTTKENAIASVRQTLIFETPSIQERYGRLDSLTPQEIENLKADIYSINRSDFGIWGISTACYIGRVPAFEGSYMKALSETFPDLDLNPLGFKLDWSSKERAIESVRYIFEREAPEILDLYDRYDQLSQGQIELLKEKLYGRTDAHFDAWGLGAANIKTSAPYFGGSYITVLQETFPLAELEALEFWL
ncbi:MAG: phosphoglycerate kinase, partial [Candidatus Theseobacter exili]|nr:phosphoglycerate kinase [Candidatus Theseobacter exili]